MGGNCYRKNHEAGPWYELLTIRNMIDARITAGKDTFYPRFLYLQWLKFPEYLKGDQDNRRRQLYGDLALLPGEHFPTNYVPTNKLSPVDTLPSPDFDVLNFETSKYPPGTVFERYDERPTRHKGRPRGGHSRATLWRRLRERQAVMI